MMSIWTGAPSNLGLTLGRSLYPWMSAAETENAADLRRLDHVAVAVDDTAAALRYFRDRLGLAVLHVDELEEPPVTLTYLDAGNIYIQLVAPHGPCEIATWLEEHGEGLHHICFAVENVPAATSALSDDGLAVEVGSGRGRPAAFVRNESPFGVLIECTELHPEDGATLAPRSYATRVG